MHHTEESQPVGGALLAHLIDGKKHARNVYAHSLEECEENLQALIIEMKAELAELKRQKAEGTLPPQAVEKSKKKAKKTKKKSK